MILNVFYFRDIHLAGCKEDNVDCRIHHEEERNMFLDKKITMYKLWRILHTLGRLIPQGNKRKQPSCWTAV